MRYFIVSGLSGILHVKPLLTDINIVSITILTYC